MKDVSAQPTGRRATALGMQILLVLAAVLGSLLVAAGPASASSTNCAFYGTGIKYGVRNGSFCSSIAGSGTDIRTVYGNFGTTVPNLDRTCAPSIKIDIYDRFGRWITWRQGPRAGGCYWGSYNNVPPIAVNWDFPAARGGRVRVTLQDSGNSKVETWHGLG